MAEGSGVKRACDFYIRHVRFIGALYCVVPTLAWFGGTFAKVDFREVYLARLGISLVVGGLIAAWVNRFGLWLWIIKHRSPRGPATVIDGGLIGAAVGVGSCFLPPLTSLIHTNHPEMAKTFIIIAWLAAPAIGAVIGMILAAVGRKHVEREWPAGEGQAQ
jgi:hypothetical protein